MYTVGMSDLTSGINEIVLYQPDESVRLEVVLGDNTVWLTQTQMIELFQSSQQNISLHINKIYKEGELDKATTVKEYLTVLKEGSREIRRSVKHYNLDVIISVGYRVKSQRGTQFRIWATNILREYLLRGYAVNQRFEQLERRVDGIEKQVGFFVKTALPPVEGIFFDGQLFDAYEFVCKLVKSAKKRIILIDNYVDETVLGLLAKRKDKVSATIHTARISNALQADINKHNAQYPPITVAIATNVHDRFLIIDNDVYHIGASVKDLGKKMFAFSKMGFTPKEILQRL